MTMETLKEKVDAFERLLICNALEESTTKTQAAESLGLTRATLYAKMRKHDLVGASVDD